METATPRTRWAAPVGAGTGPVASILGAIAVAVIAPVVVLVGAGRLAPGVRAGALTVALAAWAVVVVLGWRHGGLPTAPVFAGTAVLVACSVVTPSSQSLDVFSYAMYGRMVTVHHANPYDSVPADFPADPMRRRVGPMWQRTPDIYGPVFTSVMVGAAPLVGTSPLRARLVYQLVAAAAIAAVLALLWRMTRSAVAIAFVGLGPLTAVSVVNGGHPDVLVALGLLCALVLALRRRPWTCGLALALAAGVNAVALVAAAALAVWALRRWTRREVLGLVVIVGGLGVLPYLVLPGWLANAHAHQELVSRQSIWRAASLLLVDLGPLGSGTLDAAVSPVTRSALVALLVVVFVRCTRSATPAFAMAAALGAFAVTSPWVMPWYVFAALPLLAPERPGLLGWSLGGYGGLILVGDQLPRLRVADGVLPPAVLSVAVPIVVASAVVAAIIIGPPARRRLGADDRRRSPVSC